MELAPRRGKEDIIANTRVRVVSSPHTTFTPRKSRNVVLLGSLTEEQLAHLPLKNETLVTRVSISRKTAVRTTAKKKESPEFYLRERQDHESSSQINLQTLESSMPGN